MTFKLDMLCLIYQKQYFLIYPKNSRGGEKNGAHTFYNFYHDTNFNKLERSEELELKSGLQMVE